MRRIIIIVNYIVQIVDVAVTSSVSQHSVQNRLDSPLYAFDIISFRLVLGGEEIHFVVFSYIS